MSLYLAVATDTTMTCANYRHPLQPHTENLESPVPHLEASEIPSDAEESPIESTRKDVAAEIARLDDESDRAIPAFVQPRSERERAQSFAEHQALVSPIRRMPTEIMSEIFMLCLRDPGLGEYTHGSSEAPLLLAQINRRWRDVALYTPRLWSTITVSPSQADGASMLRTWVERSAPCPMSLTIPGRYSKFLDYTDLIRTMIPHSERWKSVSLSMPLSQHLALTPVRGCLSSLQSLELSCTVVDVPLPPLFDAYDVAPRLRVVELEPPFSSSTLSLPWSQLETWSGAASSLEQHIDLFHRATNLTSCRFPYLADPRQSVVNAIPVVHSSLSSLHVEGDIFLTSTLLSFLVLPLLRELTVREESVEDWSQHDFNAFLARSPRLEVLNLEVKFSASELAQMLACVPSVVEIDIVCNEQTRIDSFIKRLVYRPGRTRCLAPRLEVMRFHGFFTLSERALAQMLMSRWRLGTDERGGGDVTRLRSVRIDHYEGEADMQFVVHLASMARQGLDLELWYGQYNALNPRHRQQMLLRQSLDTQ